MAPSLSPARLLRVVAWVLVVLAAGSVGLAIYQALTVDTSSDWSGLGLAAAIVSALFAVIAGVANGFAIRLLGRAIATGDESPSRIAAILVAVTAAGAAFWLIPSIGGGWLSMTWIPANTALVVALVTLIKPGVAPKQPELPSQYGAPPSAP